MTRRRGGFSKLNLPKVNWKTVDLTLGSGPVDGRRVTGLVELVRELATGSSPAMTGEVLAI
jgi:hypothetical protein